jgi:hypothetical protein
MAKLLINIVLTNDVFFSLPVQFISNFRYNISAPSEYFIPWGIFCGIPHVPGR